MKELCYVMVKPMYAENNFGEIDYVEKRLLSLGMKILEAGFVNYTEEYAKKHYSSLVKEHFYPELEEYITSGKAYGMVVSGDNARQVIRSVVGSTKAPEEGSIRYELLKHYPNLSKEDRITKNGVHCTDTKTDPMKEIDVFKDLLELKKTEESQL